MKVNILYECQTTPWGGANQFLKALQFYFLQHGVYAEDVTDADVILFNSHHQLGKLISLKKKHNRLVLVHRVDGPISRIRDRDMYLDKMLFMVNDRVADATIFQSQWSRQANYELGLKKKCLETVIPNAPDPAIFNAHEKKPFGEHAKIRLIATSWSSNWRKGFRTYQWLDEHLNFEKYCMTFIGNSPIQFKRIQHVAPLQSRELAQYLKDADIFITASQNDPCSNSLIEALHCRLPAVALHDGGHPEIIGRGGEFFHQPEEIPERLLKIENNYAGYQQAIRCSTMDKVGRAYYDFLECAYNARKPHVDIPKQLHLHTFFMLQTSVLLRKAGGRFRNFIDSRSKKAKGNYGR